MSPRRYATEALVLRVVPFAETSQVIHLATAEHGLVAALAKGARRPGPTFQGGLSLLAFGDASLARRPGAELELLRQFRQRDAFLGLGRDLERYLAASYVVDLLRAWMRPALPSPSLYRAGLATLRALDGARGDGIGGWVLFFEARAVAAAGHRPRLDGCAVCDRAVASGAAFSPLAGGVVHGPCAPSGGRTRLDPAVHAGLIRLYTARLPELVRAPIDPATLRAIRRIHDLWIPHLLERRPVTLELLPRS